MRHRSAGTITAICASILFPGAAMAGTLEDVIKKNGYQPILPPSTEGQPGTLYAKVKTTDGKTMPMPVCDLFPAAKTQPTSATNQAVQTSEEVWSDIDKQSEAGFNFLVSLTKAFKAITGGSVGASWNRVKKTDIEWGPITTKSLVLLEVKQAAAASRGSGTYKGSFDAACFDEARNLLAAKQAAFVMAKVAQASTLKAKIELNPQPEAKAKAEAPAADKPKTDAGKTEAGAAKPTYKVGEAADGAVAKVVASAGDAAAAKLKGDKPADPKAEAKPDAKGDTKTTPAAGDKEKPKEPAKAEAGPPKPGVKVDVDGNLLDLLKIKVGFGVSQTATDELTFAKPMNVGAGFIDLKEMKKVGLLSAPQFELKFDAVDAAEALSAAGAITESDLAARRSKVGYVP